MRPPLSASSPATTTLPVHRKDCCSHSTTPDPRPPVAPRCDRRRGCRRDRGMQQRQEELVHRIERDRGHRRAHDRRAPDRCADDRDGDDRRADHSASVLGRCPVRHLERHLQRHPQRHLRPHLAAVGPAAHWFDPGLEPGISLSISGTVQGSQIQFGSVAGGVSYTAAVSGGSMSGKWRLGPTAARGGNWSASKACRARRRPEVTTPIPLRRATRVTHTGVLYRFGIDADLHRRARPQRRRPRRRRRDLLPHGELIRERSDVVTLTMIS